MPINDPEKSENMRKSIRVYSGSSNRPLAQKIAEYLGVELSGLTLKQFANGEIYARYDETVRGADVFLIQSVAGGNVNDMLMELLIATDAAKRASARSITAVITHYGYARQDRKAGPREPITARLVANLLERAGVNRIITLDLHQGQIQGFFDIPVNHLSALPLFGQYYNDMHFDTDNLVVVSPTWVVPRPPRSCPTCSAATWPSPTRAVRATTPPRSWASSVTSRARPASSTTT